MQSNVRKAVADLGIPYPVALDNGFAIWRMFDKKYWPAHYFIDAKGIIRHHGNGKVTGQRLYQLIRQSGTVDEGTFAIEFLDPGLEAFAFTFG